jgi:uncharacterized membrane protein YidH (DUF202 family)
VPADDPEDADPGLARERTSLAWARTAIAFAAVGGVMLREELIPGLIVLALSPLVWALGHVASRAPRGRPHAGRVLTVTVTVVTVAVLATVVALLAHGPGSTRQLLHG